MRGNAAPNRCCVVAHPGKLRGEDDPVQFWKFESDQRQQDYDSTHEEQRKNRSNAAMVSYINTRLWLASYLYGCLPLVCYIHYILGVKSEVQPRPTDHCIEKMPPFQISYVMSFSF